MQVSEMLDLMATLSIGKDNVTNEEKNIFLTYLNLVNIDLYQETATFNQDLITYANLTTIINGGADLVSSPYSMINVFDDTNKRKLEQVSLQNLLMEDADLSRNNYPEKYYVQKNTINLYPVQNTAVALKVWYVPQPETITLMTAEANIPCPPAFHSVLVDSTLYYVFTEEAGFRNPQKAIEAKMRSEIGKSKLLSYLYNSNAHQLSTFGNV